MINTSVNPDRPHQGEIELFQEEETQRDDKPSERKTLTVTKGLSVSIRLWFFSFTGAQMIHDQVWLPLIYQVKGICEAFPFILS